ncbi:MAG: signal peptidase I [Planctomycetota bacterium]|nr:MAG: signal peptidase I [Planctomycetota bacterium]
MEQFGKQTVGYPERRYSVAFEGIIDTLKWVLIALVLALIFRAFVMEAFRIPTGSMAETLRGAHYHLRCPRCGYKYNVGGDYYSKPKPRCPSCGYFLPEGTPKLLANGDRILVLKNIYQFTEPKRWDVIVFKNPLEPQVNYVKRLIAGPGETVEIIDGDIYINGQIARKPPAVQAELWMPVYDNDFQPFHEQLETTAAASGPHFGRDERWQQPFRNTGDSNWDFNANGPTVFGLDSDPNQVNTIVYDTSIGNDFRATYGYNSSSDYSLRPFCSDLMVRFYVSSGSRRSLTGAGLKKYETFYYGWVDFSGNMTIERIINGKSTLLKHQKTEPIETSAPIWFQFANVDHQLILEFGPQKLKYDLGRGPDDAGSRDGASGPALEIFGAGKLQLRHLGIYRDIHYISKEIQRAQQGNGFRVGKDEFFACGDNSPYSSDCRVWTTEGIGNNGVKYRIGIVPRDYLVGKAVMVYWSDAFRPFENLLPIIPNIGQIRAIIGGSDEEL